MALTVAQWQEKLRGWVPSWWFESEQYQIAIFKGIAAVMAQVQADSEAYVRETFILQSTDPFLDTIGDERGVDRVSGESDAAYALRVQSLLNQSNKVAIKRIVDSLLLVGECTIKEGQGDTSLFLDRESFLDRDEYLTDYRYNYFLIVVKPQEAIPDAFCDRESFTDREDFLGSDVTPDTIYESIIAAVDQVKALGVFYRIVESTH